VANIPVIKRTKVDMVCPNDKAITFVVLEFSVVFNYSIIS
jgi:hypothetical protein